MASSDIRSLSSTRFSFSILDERTHFLHSTDTNQLNGVHVKAFHSAFFVQDSLWICGWNENIIGQKNIVFLNVQWDDYDIISKNELKYPEADKPLIVFNSKEIIFFTKRDGNEIHSFNTKAHEFRSVFRTNFVISAMCGSENHFYILDKYQPEHIVILDSSYHASGRITTGLKNIRHCKLDICLEDDCIVISTSFPLGTIRLLDRVYGSIWQVDIRDSPGEEKFPARFDPCNVSIVPDSRILFADRYSDVVSENCAG